MACDPEPVLTVCRCSPRTRGAFHPGRTVLALALLSLGPSSLDAQQAYRIAPPPAWVKPIAADLGSAPPAEPVTNGYELLLVDRQESVSRAGVERFRHVAYRLLDEGAVEDNSQLEFSVDPTYERLTLHAVTVTRDGRTVNQLEPGRIRVAQRESEMDYHVFDGSVSVVLVLEDVKRGDVVEYSYTVRGSNPVFAGHYMTGVSLQESVPLKAMSFRLLWPRDRPLFIRRHQTGVEPVVADVGDRREYSWTARDVPPKVLDGDLPDWYDPYPVVRLSDFASWGQVAAWGDSLFASPGPLPAALQARLARIRSGHATPAGRVEAALRYVQDDIRYLGVEIGVNSHMPFPPATVVRRGYGDCKDKAQLLVTMLRELGVPAEPALVSTTYREHMRDFLPTARYFNHAIVRAVVDGHAYWLDPTARLQRGVLAGLAPPFGAALVLGTGWDSLATIPAEPVAEPLTEVMVSFELGPVGKPTTMRVETDYRGRAAADVRQRTRAVSPEKLQRLYTEYYAESYPGIRSEAAPRIEDNEATNVVHSTEHYVIPDFWRRTGDGKDYDGTFDPVELDRTIPSPGAAGRTMPLAVDHPLHMRYTIRARLKEGWSIAPEADTVVTPVFRFSREVGVEDGALTLRYEYRTLADHVDPPAVADHLAKLSRLRRLLTFGVTPPAAPGGSVVWLDPREINWPVLLAALLTAGFAVLGALRLQRSPAPAWPRWGSISGPPEPGLTGIGGWLVLVGLGICLVPVKLITVLVSAAPAYTASGWARLTTAGGVKYHPLYAPVLLLELVGNITLLVFGCLLVWQFFRRQRWFPALFVLLSGGRVAVEWSDALLASGIPAVRAHGEQWAQHVGNLLAVILWIAYMFKSRRVRNTFVN